MRINRDLLAIVVLLLVFIVGGILLSGTKVAPSRQVGSPHPIDPSIGNDRASGSLGVYRWVAAEGYQPVAWRLPWTQLAQSHSRFLFCIDPQLSSEQTTLTGGPTASTVDPTVLTSADAASLVRWISQGNTAVLMTSGQTHSGGAPGTFAEALGITVRSPGGGSQKTQFAPLQPTVDTRGIISIHSSGGARVNAAQPSGLPLFGDNAGPLVLTTAYGAGRLVVIADSLFASNSNLGQAENARFLENLLADYAPSRSNVLFDEYHLGDSALMTQGGIWQALGRPLQLTLVQLTLAALLVLGFVGVRAGKPVPVSFLSQRTTNEYITSFAGLYQRAGAAASALETLYRAFLRELTARLALSPDAGIEQIAEMAGRRGQTDGAALNALMRECEQRLKSGRLTETEMLELVRRMERVRKDIGIA